MSTILNGQAVAQIVLADIAAKVADMRAAGAGPPGLAAVLVGDDWNSRKYVEIKRAACARVGITSFLHEFPSTVLSEQLLATIDKLNLNPAVHGILVQLPLPTHIEVGAILRALRPAKDVDGFHPTNLGKLVSGCEDGMVACTPLGCMRLLAEASINPAGCKATVVGRSLTVGRPLALLLISAGATVTVCNRSTPPALLAKSCREADILIAATGHPGLITSAMVKPGATVIDVGLTRGADGKLRGDVDFEAVQHTAGAITPVPGGVGPLTVAMLMANTLIAAQRLGETT